MTSAFIAGIVMPVLMYVVASPTFAAFLPEPLAGATSEAIKIGIVVVGGWFYVLDIDLIPLSERNVETFHEPRTAAGWQKLYAEMWRNPVCWFVGVIGSTMSLRALGLVIP